MLALFVDNPHVVQMLSMLGIGAILVIAGCLLSNSMAELLGRFRRLGWACKIGVLVVVAQLTMFGGAKHGGTNDVDAADGTNVVTEVSGTNEVEESESGEAESFPLQGEGHRGPFLNGRPSQPLTSGKDSASPFPVTDILRGYRLESVATNDDISYALSSGATVRGTWHLTGAYEDVQKVSLVAHSSSPVFLFPLGTNLCDSLWTYTWGRVRPQLKNIVNEITVVGAPMSAIPEASRFWTMLTTNDTYLMTWENFAAGRINGEAESFPLQNGIASPLTSGEDTASPLLSAQIELNRNGDFITRSNNVESVYRRVIEPNPEPLNSYGPVQDLSVINETNAYCWVDIVVNNADAWVRFEGDGPSNLADPSFAAKAGETNHVVILIGKTYKVTCDMDFSVIAKSDPAIDERWEDDHTLWLNWPVSIEAWEGNGNSFMMHVVPNFLGGSFSWTNSCCSVVGSGTHFSYSCDGHCYCTGCAANGYYGYEGYRIGCNGGWCGCSSVPGEWDGQDDPYDTDPSPSVSVWFEDDAVIFEDAYTNMPGEVVERTSTRTVLHLVAHGGMNGGTATFSFENRDKLVGFDIPTSLDVPAGHRKSYQFTYSGRLPSGSTNDIVVTGTFTENASEGEDEAATCTDETSMTSVKVELTADKTAPANLDRHRHVYGIAEEIHYRAYPSDVSNEWTFPSNFIERGGAVIMCPWTAGNGSLAAFVRACGVSYSCSLMVLEPEIEVRNLRVNQNPAEVSPVTGQAGHLLMYMDMYVLPDYVSFYDIEIREVPDESQSCFHCGYFDDRSKGGNWSHTQHDGAGVWNEVEYSGFYGTDEAGHGGKYLEPWSDGWKEWAIPMDWGVSGISHGRFRPNPTTQKFSLSSNGDFEIKKFNHTASRSVQGVVLLDGMSVW